MDSSQPGRTSIRKKAWFACAVLLLIFSLLSACIFYECRKLAVLQAEKNLEDFLLNHRAIRSFVESTQKEEIYRLKRENLLYDEYFSPQLLSSTFIARNIKDAQNEELRKRGLDEFYFKFASKNPRNPINLADQEELVLLDKFNNGSLEKYNQVVTTDQGKMLYYAIPIGRNQESCMRCHGLPENAPQEMLEQYGETAGFNERIGEVRAFMSVRVSLAGLMLSADKVALVLSSVSFILLSATFLMVILYLRKTESQELIRDRLRRAEKMESIGLMAGGVAHDLNNILAGIINYPELMLRRLPPESELRGSLEAVQRSGQRAAAVVADLLTVARGVATKKVVCDLNLLVREQLESPEFEKLRQDHSSIDFSVEFYPGVLAVLCSDIHIKKSLANLLVNAFEASRNQSVLLTGKRYFDADHARQYNAAAGDYVFIRIADSGQGIPERHLKHIFEPFYSTKKLGQSGTGLGLSVVWNTVKDHDGIVTVDSSEKGSVFTLYFPADHGFPVGISQETQESLQGSQERILVVDDEEQLRNIAVSILQEFNYSVEAVSSGKAALDYLDSHEVDLILLDMLMDPGMSGRETYSAIIKKRPHQKAVLVSGFSASEDVEETLQLGAGGFIKKPYTATELGKIVHAVLNGA